MNKECTSDSSGILSWRLYSAEFSKFVCHINFGVFYQEVAQFDIARSALEMHVAFNELIGRTDMIKDQLLDPVHLGEKSTPTTLSY